MAYILEMPSVPLTVVETPQFVRQADEVWADAERQEFVDYIARNPEAGDLIPETGGVRKVRWRRQGVGKTGRRAGDLLLPQPGDAAVPAHGLRQDGARGCDALGEEGVGGIRGTHQARRGWMRRGGPR